MKRDVETAKEYLSAIGGDQRPIIEALRKAVLAADPEVRETLRYGMLDYPGVANLGAQKHYVALYVAPSALAKHKKNFPGVDAGKSCLRFKRLDQVDATALSALLEDVLIHRRGDASKD